MSRNHHGHRSRSPSRDPDEDDDYQYALRVSAELNGEPSAPPAHHPEYDADAAFALAMQHQFDNEAQEAQDHHTPCTGYTWENSNTPISGQSAWGLNKDESSVAEYHPETPSGRPQRGLTDFIAYMQSSKCKCGEPRFRSELDINDMFQNWLDGKGELSSWLKCRSCLASSCFGCTPEPFAKQSNLKVQGKQVSWCCADGRLFLIWMLLCSFDQHFCAARSVKEKPKTNSQQKQGGSIVTTNKKTRGGGVGFGGGRDLMSYLPGAMAYGSEMADTEDDEDFEDFADSSYLSYFKGQGHTLEPRAEPADDRTKAQSAQQAKDVFNRLVLELLKGLLPSLDREAGFDMDPPKAVTDMLVESKILNYCAELLRNDSLDDATKRKDLYHALLDFLQTLGMHVMANLTLFSDRPGQPDTVNLLTLSFGRTKDVSKETASSLAENLRNLNTQSVLVLQSAKANEKDFYSEDGQEMLLLCRQITELWNYILPYMKEDSNGNVASKADLAISDVPDEQILATHTYTSKAKSLKFSPPGRFKRLITEITTLKTGLPPGIFVRYCENRPDVLKIVIIGPGGTPYENGIFEFDFFCDTNFPLVPPMVQFRGTGGGHVSINPNLYADGKVCLSLLGTWSGEPWKPGQSTLLQVVISLQAMIFCEEPWYNEPGREISYHSGPGNVPAAEYNRKIREYTVRYAMLTWLDKPPELWKAVVEFHFKQNANKILQTVEQWVNTKLPASTGRRRRFHGYEDMEADELLAMSGAHTHVIRVDLASMVSRLQSALQKYGGTHVIQHTPQPTVQKAPTRRAPVLANTISHLMSSIPMIPLPLGPPPPYSTMQPAIPTFNPSNQPRGGFWGMGRALGSGSGQPNNAPTNTAPHSRGGSVSGVPRSARGRYETRSTRGRGESAGHTGLMGGLGGSSSNTPASLFGRGHTIGRGGFATPRGRGDRGVGRGGRGGLDH